MWMEEPLKKGGNKRSWMVFWKKKDSRWEKEEGTHTHTPQILEQKGEVERSIDGSNLLSLLQFFWSY